MRMVCTFFIIFVCCAGNVVAAYPVVSNVWAGQRQGTGLVDIRYNLTQSDASPLQIQVQVYTNQHGVLDNNSNSRYYVLPAVTMQGDGPRSDVRPGVGLELVWDARRDWPDRSSVQVYIKVTAEDKQRNSSAVDMVSIPGGWFWMGDWYNEAIGTDDHPVHAVYVSSFFMARYEVTNEEMRRVLQWAYDMGKISITSGGIVYIGTLWNLTDLLRLYPSYRDTYIGFLNGLFYVVPGYEQKPCGQVTWRGAQAYCVFRSEMEGLQPCIDTTIWTTNRNWNAICDFTKNGYRLPTEAEWERAARGGLDGHHFPWWSYGGTYGIHLDGSKASYGGSGHPYYQTTPVGYYNGNQIPAGLDMANGFGLYDMAGNVAEWCYDWYSTTYYSISPSMDPLGPSASSGAPYNTECHVIRGGGYNDDVYAYQTLLCARRDWPFMDSTYEWLGFRPVRSATGVTSLAGGSGVKTWSCGIYGPFTVDTRENYPGVLMFTSQVSRVRDQAGSVTLDVARLGGTSGSVSVAFSTLAGTALAGTDYIATNGTLTWADGDRSNKTVFVSLLANPATSAARMFAVALSDPEVASLGEWSNNVVKIRSRGPANDYDGDGLSDLALFESTTGAWYIKSALGSTIAWAFPWGWPGAIPVPGDYDGDGKNDHAVFDSLSGGWYILSRTGSVLCWGLAWGWPGAMPVPGDYNRDGCADLAVFDTLSGNWYIATLAESPSSSRLGALARDSSLGLIAWSVPWGWPGAVPVSGDYDGDGRSDLAVYDTGTGYWYIQSLSGPILAWGVPWGWPSASVLPQSGDFNNDRCSDLAVWDGNLGDWYITTLAGQALAAPLRWGWPGAQVLTGDYDGDGADDLAVFDPVNSRWYITPLSGQPGWWNHPWGATGMQPVGAR